MRSHFLFKFIAHIIRINYFAVFGIGHNLTIKPESAANFADDLAKMGSFWSRLRVRGGIAAMSRTFFGSVVLISTVLAY